MLLPLFLLVAAQDAPAPPPQVRFGHLRHVQLLEPREGVVRFATQVERSSKPAGLWSERSAVCVYEGGPLAEGERQRPVAELALDHTMYRPFTWSSRPAWFLFELAGATRLAALAPRRQLASGEHTVGVLRLLDFPGGEPRLELAGVEELEDACVRAGGGELLLRRGGELVWIRLAGDGGTAERLTLDPELDVILAATIARGDAGAEPRGWCVGLRGDALFAVPFTTGGVGLSAAFGVSFDGGEVEDEVGAMDTIRLAAWAGGSKTHLAVGWPDYDKGVGWVLALELGGADAIELWQGRPDPEVDGDRSDQSEYGQALAFIPDANDDAVPELVVSGPWAFVETHVDLLSGRTGELLSRFAPNDGSSVGHWLCVSADGGRVLIGGAEWRGMPEDFGWPGHAHLLELPDLKPLASWVLEPE